MQNKNMPVTQAEIELLYRKLNFINRLISTVEGFVDLSMLGVVHQLEDVANGIEDFMWHTRSMYAQAAALELNKVMDRNKKSLSVAIFWRWQKGLDWVDSSLCTAIEEMNTLEKEVNLFQLRGDRLAHTDRKNIKNGTGFIIMLADLQKMRDAVKKVLDEALITCKLSVPKLDDRSNCGQPLIDVFLALHAAKT